MTSLIESCPSWFVSPMDIRFLASILAWLGFLGSTYAYKKKGVEYQIQQEKLDSSQISLSIVERVKIKAKFQGVSGYQGKFNAQITGNFFTNDRFILGREIIKNEVDFLKLFFNTRTSQ